LPASWARLYDRRMTLRSIAAVLMVCLAGCDGGGSGGAGGGGGTTAIGGACDTDPLRTGLTAQQTGVSADAFDCENLPCGTPDGWSADESGCFGLMQVVPACGGTAGLLPDGHPDMATDPSSSDWAGSIFNPAVNIEIGVGGVAGNRAQVKQKFAGCTEDQYTLMAIGDYNSYGSTKSCTDINADYVSIVLEAYQQYAAAAGYAAHGY
jgi:hypothetical protein